MAGASLASQLRLLEKIWISPFSDVGSISFLGMNMSKIQIVLEVSVLPRTPHVKVVFGKADDTRRQDMICASISYIDPLGWEDEASSYLLWLPTKQHGSVFDPRPFVRLTPKVIFMQTGPVSTRSLHSQWLKRLALLHLCRVLALVLYKDVRKTKSEPTP
jgi:hypothetical protein